jgi:hypothetical protein
VLRHPEHEHVWLLGDGSGHAFKHAPAIAAAMELLLTSGERVQQTCPDVRLG